MSMEAIQWAKQQKPKTATQRAVLMALADYANKEGLGWPSQKTLAADMLLSDRTIRTALAGLEAEGLIVRISKRNPDGTRGVDRIQLTLTDELRQQAVIRSQRKIRPLAKPAEISSETTGKSCQNHRKSTTEPAEAVSAQEPSLEKPSPEIPHKMNGSEPNGSVVPATAVSTETLSVEDRVWFEGKPILMAASMTEAASGRVLGRLISEFRDHARILDALHRVRDARSQDAYPLLIAILRGNSSARSVPSKGRRSGMVSIALSETGSFH